MDGPKVNTDREQSMFHKLIGYGSCNLHTVHGRLKTGAENSGWKLRKILKGAFQILRDIPARREDYVSTG